MSQTLTLPNLFLSPEPSFLSPTTTAGSSSSSFSSVRMTPVKAVTATETATRRSSKTSNSSLYDVLRVKRNASLTEIKKAYRTLAKVYHPDASSDSESESDDGLDFIALHNAYATLSDPAARASYDLSLGHHYRKRPVYASASSASSSSFSSPFSTRRWETDQCW